MRIKNIKDIASKIKDERKKQNLTQTQLAGLCNVGLRFIVDLEAGKETCQIGKVLLVLDVLGINLVVEE
ncbi:MAG: helix-turn-helix transcriptional regulator [Alphaproteobacteria bacterium]|nr:helix-turn-helix transcriptional regulator [Alphaproteobacteria bacterium]